MIGPRRQETGQHPQQTQMLLRAALTVFAEMGLRDGRIEDIAALAGMSKGAVYLHFPSKAALFQAAVRFAITAQANGRADLKRALVRIMIRDGLRFPDLAECYHRTILAPKLAAVRDLAATAVLTDPAAEPLARVPQLVLVPGCFAIVWNALFGEIDPLDEGEFEECFRHLLPAGAVLAAATEGAADGR